MSSRMSRVVVKFPCSGVLRVTRWYISVWGLDDKETLADMLQERAPGEFSAEEREIQRKELFSSLSIWAIMIF
ncbi:MAG: hypothetical protein ACLUVG_05370 [Phocaeicola vulgatus]